MIGPNSNSFGAQKESSDTITEREIKGLLKIPFLFDVWLCVFKTQGIFSLSNFFFSTPF